MAEFALNWYYLLSGINASVALPLSELAGAANISVLSALIFGLIGATSPCQITTNVSAFAYLLRGRGGGGSPVRSSIAFLLGKAIVYTLLGAGAILVGRGFDQASIPVIAIARKVVGPAMIVLALYLFGLIPLRFTLGHRLSSWVEQRAGSGSGGAFLLGAAFSLAFCPTLFLLFFVLTIPLAIASPAGILYPAVFAAGTTLPLLAGAGVVTLAGARVAQGLPGISRIIAQRLQPFAAAVVLLAGLNDTWLYWLV